MKSFRLFMAFAMTLCFLQSSFAQTPPEPENKCEAMMQRAILQLQSSANEMTAEEGNFALNSIMNRYNRCMGHDFGGFEQPEKPTKRRRYQSTDTNTRGQQTGGIGSPKRPTRRPPVRIPETNTQSQEPGVIQGSPERETKRRRDYKRKNQRETPLQTKKQLEEQRKIEEAAEKGQNPDETIQKQKRMEEDCRRYTQSQRDIIIKERDIAVNKISSAVQRRQIFSKADQKIRGLMLECMSNYENQD